MGDTSNSSRVVMVVDGDPETAALFRRASRDLPLQISHARTADEAWHLLFVHRPIAVFADYRLVGFDGISLLELVAEYLPSAKRILHTAERIIRPAVGLDIPVLGKPCDEAALTDLLRSLEPLEPRTVQPGDAG